MNFIAFPAYSVKHVAGYAGKFSGCTRVLDDLRRRGAVNRRIMPLVMHPVEPLYMTVLVLHDKGCQSGIQ
jgi:hypothetical protein